MEGFLTVAEFIRLYAIGRTSLYRMVKADQLRIVKIGRSARIAKSEAQRWVDSLPTTGGRS
jgi:excisionase family DNA binding protein